MKTSHNSAPYVIAKLSGEIAYTQKRLCVRMSSERVQEALKEAAAAVECALHFVRKDERK